MQRGKELLAEKPLDAMSAEEQRLAWTYKLHKSRHQFYGDLVTWCKRLLAPEHNGARAAQWEQVVADFPIEALTPAEQEFLSHITRN